MELLCMRLKAVKNSGRSRTGLCELEYRTVENAVKLIFNMGF